MPTFGDFNPPASLDGTEKIAGWKDGKDVGILLDQIVSKATSFAEIARKNGIWGVLPTDSDAVALNKFANYAITQNSGFQSTIPGRADNTYTQLSTFRASDVTRQVATLVGVPGVSNGRFFFEQVQPGEPAFVDDGVDYIKADSISLSEGAWVREGGASIRYGARGVASKLDETVSVLDFIPPALHAGIKNRSNTTDLTNYVQAAFNYVDTIAEPQFAGGATLYFPAGDYRVTCLNVSNNDPAKFTTGPRLLGDGRHASRIVPAAAGAILLLGLGRNHMTIENMEFWASEFAARAGIYLCRSTASPNCNNNKFINVRVAGNFSACSVVSIGAESSLWINCLFENNNPSANYRTLWTGTDPSKFAVTLPGGSSTPTTGPNTDNRMISCEFQVAFNNSRPITFSQQGGWTMTSCTIICGPADNCHLVTYSDVNSGYFNGPVTWENPHFEVLGVGNSVHYLDAPSTGPSYFVGINIKGGNYVVSNNTPILDYDRTTQGKQPILQSSFWETPIVPIGTVGNNFYIYAMQACSVHYRPTPTSGTLIAFGFIDVSQVDVGELRCTNLANTSLYTVAGIATPITGTWARGSVVRNAAPAVGQPQGWVCTASGTAGTLGAVAATTTTGSNLITIAGANTANLYEGAQITIAGAGGGPFIVQVVAGNSVYLDRVVASTVSAQAVSFNAPAFSSQANL